MNIKRSKRIRSVLLLLLTACMVVWAFPITARAYSDPIEPTGNDIFDAFLNEPDYTSDAPWGSSQHPKLSEGGGSGCYSYCLDFIKYCFGEDYIGSGEKFDDPNEVRAGDVIYTRSTYDHWFVVLKREGNMLYTAEGNYNDVVRTGWKYQIIDNDIPRASHHFVCGYHFTEAPVMNTWVRTDGYWVYYDSFGLLAKSCWERYAGRWYYFDEDCKMVTDWQLINGVWYYFSGSGAMQTGWKKISGTWYYFAGSGAMARGWRNLNGVWYYVSGGGALQTGWKKISGTWYYFSGGGAMQTGWKKIGGIWYYFSESGAMQTGSCEIDGVEYFFDQSGAWISE